MMNYFMAGLVLSFFSLASIVVADAYAANGKGATKSADIGDYVCSYRYEGNDGWCGTVEDIRGDKLRINVLSVRASGWSSGLNASTCSGNKKINYNASDVLIWVPSACIDSVK